MAFRLGWRRRGLRWIRGAWIASASRDRGRHPDTQRGGADRHLPRDARGGSAPGFELDVLVVDSGSTDATLDDRALARRPDPRAAARRLRLLEVAERGHRAGARRPRADPLRSRRAGRRALGGADDRAVRGPARGRGGEPAGALGGRPVARGARASRDQFGDERGATTPRRHGRDRCSATPPPASGAARGASSRSCFRRPRTSSGRGGWWRRAGRWSTSRLPPSTTPIARAPRAQAQRLIDISRVAPPDAPARTRRRTVREAAGLFYRDSSSILGLDEPPGRKLAHLAELVRIGRRTTWSTSRARAPRPSGAERDA